MKKTERVGLLPKARWLLLTATATVSQTGCQSHLHDRSSMVYPSLAARSESASRTPINQSTPNDSRLPQSHYSNLGNQPSQETAFPSDVIPASAYGPAPHSIPHQNNGMSPRMLLGPTALPPQAMVQPVGFRKTSPSSQHHPQHSASCGCNHSPQNYQRLYPEFASRIGTSAYSFDCPSDGYTDCPSPSILPIRYTDHQEYIYNGGDAEPYARIRDDLSLVGVDTEDTLIRYETQGGTIEVQTGCRVPIYAPRFASTRKIIQLGQQDSVASTVSANLDQSTGKMQDALPPTHVRDRKILVRDKNVHVVEAFRDRNRGVPVEKILPAIGISDAFKPYEDLQVIRFGKLNDAERPQVAKATQAALAWTSIEELVVLVDNVELQIVESGDQPSELFTYELDGKPRVRLCKVASHQIAESGDVIDFTIRFDNIGDHTISNILVQDSLAPRLEYVEGSQKSNFESEFSTEPNRAGSAILSWNIQGPVKPGEGGLIRFQCKVR